MHNTKFCQFFLLFFPLIIGCVRGHQYAISTLVLHSRSVSIVYRGYKLPLMRVVTFYFQAQHPTVPKVSNITLSPSKYALAFSH